MNPEVAEKVLIFSKNYRKIAHISRSCRNVALDFNNYKELL